ncbi:hypothetical protein PEPCOX59622_00485 [Aedoeadaptatus coxii]|uniref:S-layer homology domain-containing protein n=1 Tax=Aedoeadaptatus coxii TaxID=755172 RepID=UPI00176CB39F|nr:S-layer homology domain-containing protein [Peptoniphilus coxii]CAC9929069.1 hypothetical protein PEPCOX59622_00485 [Peptoniphilus coxii]
MRKRVSSLVLAIAMLLQTLVPQTIIAKEGAKAPSDNLVKVGMINGNSYDSKLMLELNRLTAKNRKKRAVDPGARLFGYFEDGQEPEDGDKAKYYGEVKADLTVKGLDGNPFQWNEVFGTEEVHLRFIQMNDDTGAETGIERVLNVKKAGTYTWTDGDGNPADLPLFNNKLEPLIYEVKLDEEVSDRVKLLTARLTTTKDASPTFDRPDADGRIKYHLTLEIGLQQVASSKFVSEWHTAVGETERPQLVGTVTGSMDSGKSKIINFNLPTNNKAEVIVRTASRRDKNKLTPEFLYKTPTTDIKTDTAGLTFKDNSGVKTVEKDGHKYKYDFKYDVIKGGKLTMTELLPVTFDANGGEFKNFTAPDTKTKIVKEVEYDGTLTKKADEPTQKFATFKGWSETKDGTPLSKEKFEEATKNIIKSKTFYAIWENNEITANRLEVKESFKDGTGYVNDFIPDLSKLKGQVKIKDSNGVPQALANEDTFEILNDSETAVTGDGLKNYLYEKLQEKDNPKDEPTRVETVKAKVTVNGRSKIVEIPIKVIKNIYEAKTLTEKPYYVPDGYKKVTLDPTKKATDSQKTYYYVNPEAKVVIPGQNPTGKGENKFIKWTMKADDAGADVKGVDYTLANRHQFEKASTITAQYSADVVPQEGENKPEGVPGNFVKVIFVPTDNGTMEGAKIFWVNPAVDVKIPVKDPKGKTYYTFKEWKIGADAAGDKYDPTTPKNFTEQETAITATYTEGDKIIPFNPEDANPMVRPDGYVKVTFKAETGLKFKDSKAYYVKKDAGVTLKTIKDDTTKGYPGYDVVKGYKFDKWDPADTTEIKDKDIVVTAKATPLSDVMEKKDGETKPEGYVEVTFVPTDKAVDTATKTFWVNPEKAVTIPVTDPKGTTYYTFTEWKVGANADGAVYKPTVGKKFTEDTTITATYDKAEDIIAYDPKDPKTKPEGYVRVTFEAEEGLTLSNDKAYYVKKDAKITLGNVKLAKPDKTAKTGYEFKEWNKKDDLVLGTEDVVVKALATTLPDSKEKKPGEQAPAGYVEVKFVAGENGKLTENNKDITEKVYYVNPTKYVTITTPPTAVGNIGYKFGAWDKDPSIPTVYTAKETIITASFNPRDAVIPKTKPDDSEKPVGYVTVTFELEKVEKKEAGKINPRQTITYFVKSNTDVTIPEPGIEIYTGYKFNGWSPNIKVKTQFSEDTTVKGKFTKLDDIIPATKSTPIPDGYVTVTFINGHYGTLEGQTIYYVNPKAGITVGSLRKPKVNPNVGYEFTNEWSHTDTTIIKKSAIIEPGYNALDDVIPQKKTDGKDKPNGYITVTFVKGDHGSLEGTTVYYVNPNKSVVLKDKAPTIKPNTGYKSAGWDTSIERAIQYKDGDKITALYNEPGTISKTEVAGYVKVEFKPGTNGELKGTTKYWIKPGVEVNVPAPAVKPNIGYKFDKWDKSLTVTASAGDPTYEITAIYAEEDTIIPKTKADDSEKPKGYVTVTFTTDGNGSLEGTTTYFVNPNKEADFTQTAENMTKKPKIGYTEKGGTWSPTNFKKTFTENEEFKFSFVKLENVIPAVEGEARPEGYVTVTLIPTDKATDQTKAKKSYWVKANTDISISSKPTGKEETLNGITYTYTFKGWSVTRGTIASWDTDTIAGKFIQDTEITAQYTTKVDGGIIVAAPVPKKNAVTPVGDKPKAEDLIGNPFNPKDPTNPNNLLKDSKISYADNGVPSVDQDGKVTAKVKIEYPNGKTTVIDVPVTVVNNVVPQVGNNKPLVPDTYVKVTVDTTDNATANTKFTRVFWVKPNVKVTIPDILDPTGKAIDEKGVTKTNKFKQWKLEGSNPEKFYDHGSNITDTFTEKESTIVATYEQDKNLEPKAQDNVVIPKDSKPSPKDFIKNPYNDNDPNNKDNLPPGTIFEFVPGKEPNTANPGEGMTTIKITYPNGEKRTVDVPYRVTENIVEQPGDDKPSTVPDNFVKVTIVPTDKAKDKKNIILWVNPNEELSLPLPTIEPIDGWLHNGWSMTAPQKGIFGNLPRFYSTETVIEANFSKIEKPKEPERIVDTRVETRVIEVPVRDRNYRKEVWYMCGFGGDFRPHDGLKRSEAAQILANALREDGYQYDPNYPIAYKDVGKNWYAEAVRITTQANVFVGYPDGYFRPDDKISTVEWIATLRRFQQIAKEDGNHMNLRTGHWATGEIEAAYKAGWLGIYPQGLATFKADTPMPREEVAAVSNRAFNRVMDRDYIRRNDKNMTHYRDVNPSMWSYDDILLASNTFMHDGRFFKAHGITQDNVIFNVNIDGLTITQDLFQRVKR